MICLRLSAVVNDVTVEIEGEADSLLDIQEAWESFILATNQVEYGTSHRPEEQYIHQKHHIDLSEEEVCT